MDFYLIHINVDQVIYIKPWLGSDMMLSMN